MKWLQTFLVVVVKPLFKIHLVLFLISPSILCSSLPNFPYNTTVESLPMAPKSRPQSRIAFTASLLSWSPILRQAEAVQTSKPT